MTLSSIWKTKYLQFYISKNSKIMIKISPSLASSMTTLYERTLNISSGEICSLILLTSMLWSQQTGAQGWTKWRRGDPSLTVQHGHMGAEPQNSFKRGSRGPAYGKWTTRHHISRYYVSPNQSCKVFGDFGPKNWLTSRHDLGHVTRATCLMKVPWAGPWAVDSFRHRNFSIC